MSAALPLRDLFLGLALGGLALLPVLPASATIPICTADGRKDGAPDGPMQACHAVCERRREG